MRILVLFCLSSICSADVLAGNPLWTFAMDPAFPPQVSVSASSTATVKYTVTNHSLRPHQLQIVPIPGISQAGPCQLGPKGSANASCVLVLNILGSALPANPIQGGPFLCQMLSNPKAIQNQCYQPSPEDRLDITKSSVANQSYFFAAGAYTDTNSIQRPLILVGLDSGGQWVYPASVNEVVFTPDNTTHPYSNGGDLYDISCAGATCIAAGVYTDTTPKSLPMLALTTNHGTDWIFPSAIPNVAVIHTHPFNYGSFNAATCTSNICLAVGNFCDLLNVCYPMVVSSTDNGNSWNYADSAAQIDFVPDNVSYPWSASAARPSGFNGTSCSGSHCISVGFYYDTLGKQRPMLAESTNNSPWVYPSSVNQVQFSPDNASHPFSSVGALSKAFCNQSICIAVGSYRDNTNIYRPLLVQNSGVGNSWIYPSSINAVQFTPDNITHPYQDQGVLFGPSCSGLLCVAPGAYQDTSSGFRPLLALTIDGGLNWSYPSIINEVQFSPDNLSHPFGSGGWLGSSFCTGTTCLAAGGYTDSFFDFRPLLARSSDGGSTWVYPSEINAVIFTPDNVTHQFLNNGSFNSVSCIGDACVAAGSYTDTNGITRPLLAYSNDLGVNWSYPSDVTLVNFSPLGTPNPFLDNGNFRASATSSISAILPAPLRLLSRYLLTLTKF